MGQSTNSFPYAIVFKNYANKIKNQFKLHCQNQGIVLLLDVIAAAVERRTAALPANRVGCSVNINVEEISDVSS